MRLRSVKEDALEMQDIRELGLGWAWFMNDLRAFLPAWQEMELASPSTEEPVTQIAADVPIEPLSLQADATNLDLELQVYERPLAVTPFGFLKLFLIGRIHRQCMPSWETVVSVLTSYGVTCEKSACRQHLCMSWLVCEAKMDQLHHGDPSPLIGGLRSLCA